MINLMYTSVCQSGHTPTLQFHGAPPGDRRRKYTELGDRWSFLPSSRGRTRNHTDV